MLANFSYTRPGTLEEAVKQLASPDAGLHAGGTDILGCLHDHVFDIKKLVSISGLKELKGISAMPDNGLRIGSVTTIAGVAEHRLVNERYAALAMAAREVASPQLRNQGTMAMRPIKTSAVGRSTTLPAPGPLLTVMVACDGAPAMSLLLSLLVKKEPVRRTEFADRFISSFSPIH